MHTCIDASISCMRGSVFLRVSVCVWVCLPPSLPLSVHTDTHIQVRQQLDIAGIPVLDGFRLCVDRFDCHPDNIHWCSSVQNAKFAAKLKAVGDLTELEEKHDSQELLNLRFQVAELQSLWRNSKPSQ